MNINQQAANELKRFCNTVKSLSEVADALDKVGGLEQAALEAESRIKTALANEEALQEHIAGLNEDKAALEVALVASAKEAEHKIAAAEASADFIKVQAKQEAEAVKKAATEEGEKIIAAAKAEVAQIDADRVDAKAAFDALCTAVLERQDQLDKLQEKIAAVKSQIAALG